MFTAMILIATLCGSVSDSAVVPTAVQVDLGPNVDAMLRDLAEQIGVGAEAIYPLYLRQASVQISVYRFMAWGIGIALVVGLVLLLLGTSIDAKTSDYSDPAAASVLGGIVFGIGFILCLVFVIEGIPDWITAVNNIELWAIRHIAQDASVLVQ